MQFRSCGFGYNTQVKYHHVCHDKENAGNLLDHWNDVLLQVRDKGDDFRASIVSGAYDKLELARIYQELQHLINVAYNLEFAWKSCFRMEPIA